jgi:ABC-2 type transport system permease protein
MRNIWIVAKKEFSQYFISPIAYSVAFLLLGIVGILFILTLLSLSQDPTGANAPDSRNIAYGVAFLLMLLTPALTMRLIADEVRMGTMELLLTAPLRDYEMVVGKWLGAFFFILVVIAITLIFPLIFNAMTKNGIDQLLLISNYLGVILVAAALLALGVGISAMFSNQIAAFFTTMTLFIVLWWLIGAPANLLPQGGGEIFTYLSFSSQFSNNFIQGSVSPSSIVYFLSLTGLGLFIGSTAVEIRRWR